jgi:hypothetical protein
MKGLPSELAVEMRCLLFVVIISSESERSER